MQISLKGRTVLITAGGAGIGRATAIAMDKLGAKVFTCDIDEEALATLPASISGHHCDVSNSAQVDDLFSKVRPHGLTVLVNNAGVSGPTKPIEEIDDQEWQRCMQVGIDSQFYCARRAVPIFKAQRSGVIINIISAAGIMGYPNRSPYVAAKWAATGLTQSLAMELGPSNIRVNGVVPGNVNGERIERVIQSHAEADGVEPETVRKLYTISTSMQCYIDPEEIADLICFLSSDYGKHISGQIIGVDGNTETLHPRS